MVFWLITTSCDKQTHLQLLDLMCSLTVYALPDLSTAGLPRSCAGVCFPIIRHTAKLFQYPTVSNCINSTNCYFHCCSPLEWHMHYPLFSQELFLNASQSSGLFCQKLLGELSVFSAIALASRMPVQITKYISEISNLLHCTDTRAWLLSEDAAQSHLIQLQLKEIRRF